MTRSWIVGVIASVVGVIAIVALLTIGASEHPATAGPIVLEPADDRGSDPFFAGQSITVTSSTPTLQLDFGDGLTVVGGTEPGLYGGTGEQICDRQLLTEFLESEPEKAAAWADVQGIEVGQIAAFISSLTPVSLQFDTLVLNHGFSETTNRATPRLSILQKGTAVLVDSTGVPRAKCICGNPLLGADGHSLDRNSSFGGTAWDDFDSAAVVAVAAGDQTDEFLLTNADDGGATLRRRPIGTDGADDVIITPDLQRVDRIETGLPATVTLDASLNLDPRSESGRAVQWSATGPCRIIDNTQIALDSTGACEVTFTSPAVEGWAEVDHTHVVIVEPGVQQIAFPTFGGLALDDAPFEVRATATSQLDVQFSSGGVCRMIGIAVVAESTGECIITASQPGNDLWQAAQPVERRTMVVESRFGQRRTQEVGLIAPDPITFGPHPISVVFVASSGLPVDVVTTGPCSFGNSEITTLGAGTCTLIATQAGDDQFEPATPLVQSIEIGKARQIIDLREVPRWLVHPGSEFPIDLPPSSTAGLAIDYSVRGPCSVTDSSLVVIGLGDCALIAEQGGDADHLAARTQHLTIRSLDSPPKLDNDIDFEQFSVACVAGFVDPNESGACGPSADLDATTTSGAIVNFAAKGSCQMDGATRVQPIAGGECTVVATSIGDGRHHEPEPVERSTVIARIPQQITFSPEPPASLEVGAATQLDITTDSNLPLAVTLSSQCSIDDGALIALNAGRCTIHVQQSGSPVHLPASASAEVTVRRRVPTLSLRGESAQSPLQIDEVRDISATSTSGLDVSVTASRDCHIGGDRTLIAHAVGVCVLELSDAGNAAWEPTVLVVSIPVNRRAQTIEATELPPTLFTDTFYRFDASVQSELALDRSVSGDGCEYELSSRSEALLWWVMTTSEGRCSIEFSNDGDDYWAPFRHTEHLDFVIEQFEIAVTTEGPGSVTVNGTFCDSPCTLSVAAGTIVEIDASPDGEAYVSSGSTGCDVFQERLRPGCTFRAARDTDVEIEFLFDR